MYQVTLTWLQKKKFQSHLKGDETKVSGLAEHLLFFAPFQIFPRYIPQFSVYFSCENPVGLKDVLGKMGQKQKNLWHKNGTRAPLGYLRFHKARTKCLLLKRFRALNRVNNEKKNQILYIS